MFRGVDFNINKVTTDPKGRFLIINVNIAQKQFVIVNSHAPIDEVNHILFLKEIFSKLKEYVQDPNINIIWGGDHNLVMDLDLK